MARTARIAIAVLATCATARADVLPAGAKVIEHTLSVDDLDAYPKAFVVAYRTECAESADDKSFYALNPRLAHLRDSELLAAGETYQAPKYCSESRLYALRGEAWTRVSEKGPTRGGLGWGRDRLFGVQEIDALEVTARGDFLAKNAVVAPYVIRWVNLVRAGSPLASMHEVVHIDALDDAAFRVRPVSVEYMYIDGTKETRVADGDVRPLPSRAGALERVGTNEDDAAPPTPATPPTNATAPANDHSRIPIRRYAIIAVLVVVLGARILRAFRRPPRKF